MDSNTLNLNPPHCIALGEGGRRGKKRGGEEGRESVTGEKEVGRKERGGDGRGVM